jgi:hypothetical protein
MSQEIFEEINRHEIERRLVTLHSDSFLEKDTLIDTLCDYVDSHSVSDESKNKITENILDLFHLENTYEIQESIFNLLVSAHAEGILREKISDLMLNYMHNPKPEFIEYAMDILMYADLPSCQKNELKQIVEQCLRSEDLSIQKGMLMIWEYYKSQCITWAFPSQPQTEP